VSIDLNADVGEGMADEELLPYVTSVNVACGFHAGDPKIMDETVAAALARGVRVGAHPGFADRENFGRVPVEMPADEIEDLVLYQVAALYGFVRSRGGALSHVKPHGALYHEGAEFPDVARAIAEGVRRFQPGLILVGAVGSMLLEAGREAGLSVAAEAFADRRYLPDGTLVPRSRPDALLTDPEEAAEQALSLARDGFAIASDGSRLSLRPDSICLHGDTPGAASIARRVSERLRQEGVRIASLESRAAGGRASASMSIRVT
jgi:5-oxoprolinase (ATP-hydrolysing) subunit A